jgi:hypothetical protein
MSNDTKPNKPSQGEKSKALKKLLQKRMVEKVDSLVEKTKDAVENETPEVDLNRDNYVYSTICPRGSLLKLIRRVDEFMSLEGEMFETFEAGFGMIVSHAFEHKETGQHVITTLLGDKVYMYFSDNFNEDFEIVSRGTMKYPTEKVDNDE